MRLVIKAYVSLQQSYCPIFFLLEAETSHAPDVIDWLLQIRSLAFTEVTRKNQAS